MLPTKPSTFQLLILYTRPQSGFRISQIISKLFSKFFQKFSIMQIIGHRKKLFFINYTPCGPPRRGTNFRLLKNFIIVNGYFI